MVAMVTGVGGVGSGGGSGLPPRQVPGAPRDVLATVSTTSGQASGNWWEGPTLLPLKAGPQSSHLETRV